MNWTGGRLSRHSRGGAAATLDQRQKAHFAKVQNNLRNGTKKQSPIKWSILDKFHLRQAVQERQTSSKPRAFSREASQQVTDGIPQYAEKSGHTARDEYQSQPRGAQQARQPTPGPVGQGRTRDDDLYSATPQPSKKRRREISLPEDGFYEVEDVDFIAKKRKQLLEKGDWVGISYQRPLQMTFSSPKNAGNVGRRRKVTDGHQVRYANRQSTLASPFMNRAPPSSPRRFGAHNQHGQTDVRIHIGGKIVPPGISSSTAPSRRSRGHSTQQQKRELSLAASSDVMLLDSEDVLATGSSRVINNTLFDDQETEAFGPDRSYGSQKSLGRHAQRGYDSGADGQVEGNWDGRHFRDYSTQYNQNPSPAGVDAESDVYSSQQSLSPILGTPFSPTLIKHPIPQSSRVSSILYSGSSAITSSTVAQIGKVKPVVPSSQVLDNEIWETWITSLCNEEASPGQHNRASDSIEQGRTISPGISTAPPRRISLPAPEHYQKNTEVDCGQSEDVDKTYRVVHPSTRDSPSDQDYGENREIRQQPRPQALEGSKKTERVQGPTRATQSLRKTGLGPNIAAGLGAVAGSRASNNAFPSASLRLKDAPTPHSKSAAGSQVEEDPDDSWRNFVFGSDERNETDESRHLPEPRTTPRSGSHDAIASSLLENLSTGMSAGPQACAELQSQNTPGHSNFGPQHHTPNTVSTVDTSSTDIPWDPPKGVASTTYLSTMDGHTTLQSSELPLQSSHAVIAPPFDNSISSSSPCRLAASMTGTAGSQPRASNSSNSPPSPKPPRVLFTKPKRFAGVKAALKPSHVEEEPLHIGRSLITDEHVGARRKQERDLYSLVDWDEISDD